MKSLANVFELVNISGGHAAGVGPFDHQSYRAIFRPVSGPAAVKGKRIVIMVRPDELGTSFDEFRGWAEERLRTYHFFSNPQILDLPAAADFELPTAWGVRLPYIDAINQRTRRDKRGERATKNECQTAPGADPSSNYIRDAGGAHRRYAFSGESPMNRTVTYPDGSFIGTDRLLHNADGSLFSGVSGNVDFSSADSQDLVKRAEAALRRAQRDLDYARSSVARSATARIENAHDDGTMSEERRISLLSRSSLGRRALEDPDDKRYAKAVRQAKADALAQRPEVVNQGGEKSRTYYGS